MNAHPTLDELRRWKRGELSADGVLAIGHHVGACATCAAAWDLGDSIDAIREQVEDEHPDLETELFAFADGTLLAERRAEIAEHLEVCDRCREDVEDSKSVAVQRRVETSRWILPAVAAAAAVIVAVTALVMIRDSSRVDLTPIPRTVRLQPPPTTTAPPPGERADWADLLRRVRSGASLEMPEVLRSIRPVPDALRGPLDAPSARLSPSGVVLETTRPTFTWPAKDGARTTVFVFEGNRQVLRSESLTGHTWTAPQELKRGVTYTWQVEVVSEGTAQILPRPPAPPALFHILDARTANDLESARRERGDDHLLLALLYAKAGLDDRAAAELALITDPADAAMAKERLGRELASWKRE